nr:hypothetical protein [Planctomycetota bacterium]
FCQLAGQTNYVGVDHPAGLGGSIGLVALTVNGPLELRGSPGDEDINVFADSVFNSPVTMDFGDGHNFVFARADAASGSLALPPVEFRREVFVTGGGGLDRYELGNAEVLDSVTAFLEGGNDVIRLVTRNSVTIALNVDLGPGQIDRAFLTGRYSGQLSGGVGDSDELVREPEEIFGDVVVTDFETIRLF